MYNEISDNKIFFKVNFIFSNEDQEILLAPYYEEKQYAINFVDYRFVFNIEKNYFTLNDRYRHSQKFQILFKFLNKISILEINNTDRNLSTSQYFNDQLMLIFENRLESVREILLVMDENDSASIESLIYFYNNLHNRLFLANLESITLRRVRFFFLND